MGTSDDDNPDEIPSDIMRLAQNVSQAWRHCRRKICKRGKGCHGRDMPCLSERPCLQEPRNPEKVARDDARAMAIFQRMLRERLNELGDGENQVAPQQATPARRRRAD